MPNGSVGEFDIIVQKNNSVVIALTPDMHVVVFEQFRPGPETVVLNFPGGNIDPHEQPEENAAKELLEETGYQGDITFLAKTMADPYISKYTYSFLALNCKKVSEPTGTELEEHPVVKEIPLRKFMELIRQEPGIAELQSLYFALDYLGKITV